MARRGVNPKTGKRWAWEEEQAAIEAQVSDAAIKKGLLLLKRQEKINLSRDDLLAFSQFTMPDPAAPNDVTKSTYEAAQFHKEVAKALEAVERGEIQQLIFAMPPRHGKTQLATKNFAAWLSGRHPAWNIAVASYSDTMAEDMGADTRAIMTGTPFRQVFTDHKLRRGGTSKSNIQTDKGGRLVFVGRGGALTGRGADCFVGETEVETPTGTKQIKDVRVGEQVLSYDERSREVVWRRVEAVARRPRARIFRVSDNAGRTVEVTGDHRLYANAGWVEAAQLAAGDRLLCAVRRNEHTAGRGDREALPARVDGFLLLERLLGAGGEPEAARRKDMRALRVAGAESERQLRLAETGQTVLLGGMPGSRAVRGIGPARAGAPETLRTLQRDVPAAELGCEILLAGLRGADSLDLDERPAEPAVGGRRGAGTAGGIGKCAPS